MNERSRTFMVEAHFINPPKKLFPNLDSDVDILLAYSNEIISYLDKKIGITDFREIDKIIYNKKIKIQDINGFLGSHLAGSKNVQIINNYVLGISKNCK